MRSSCRARTVVRCTGSLAAVTWLVAATGCSPYSTAAKIGIKIVGQAVNDAEVSDLSKKLLRQPVAMADSTFGQRIRTFEETRSLRQLITYPVKNDLLHSYRWAVEAQNGRIVALSKLKSNPSGSKSIAEKLVLKEVVIGKTPQQLESHKYFQKLTLVLRDLASGNLVRVYDTSIVPELMGATYCVLEFDASNKCREVWLVGVASSTPGSAVGG